MRIDERAGERAMHAASLAEFERFYRTNVDRVYSFARARLGDDEAEDVVAEVFHAAALAHRDGRLDTLSGAWLITVARNKVIDRWRRAARRRVVTQLVGTRDRDEAVELDSWTDRLHRDEVIATLDALSDRHRSLLVLHYVDGMPAAEIGETIGLSVAAVESALARARRQFRRHHRAQGFEDMR